MKTLVTSGSFAPWFGYLLSLSSLPIVVVGNFLVLVCCRIYEVSLTPPFHDVRERTPELTDLPGGKSWGRSQSTLVRGRDLTFPRLVGQVVTSFTSPRAFLCTPFLFPCLHICHHPSLLSLSPYLFQLPSLPCSQSL